MSQLYSVADAGAGNFRARWPHVEMDFNSGVTFDPQPALQQGELDLVMTSDILPRSGLHYSPMFDFEVRLVLAPEHPLAMKTLVTPEDLAAETLLIYPCSAGASISGAFSCSRPASARS